MKKLLIGLLTIVAFNSFAEEISTKALVKMCSHPVGMRGTTPFKTEVNHKAAFDLSSIGYKSDNFTGNGFCELGREGDRITLTDKSEFKQKLLASIYANFLFQEGIFLIGHQLVVFANAGKSAFSSEDYPDQYSDVKGDRTFKKMLINIHEDNSRIIMTDPQYDRPSCEDQSKNCKSVKDKVIQTTNDVIKQLNTWAKIEEPI